MGSDSDKKYAGIAIPVGALRTKDSCGVGEFSDLKKCADFCKKAGVNLVQILPVNDTGTESSPYSALSAFALHPLYVNLQAVPGADAFSTEILKLKKKFDSEKRFLYRDVRAAKLEILKKIFDASWEKIKTDETLQKWIEKNTWVKSYAVYIGFKTQFNEASWKEWPVEFQKLSEKEILDRWNDSKLQKDNLFAAWVQMLLDEQFSDAVAYLKKKGISLKGDIPIMMNEDSCDAWSLPKYFRDDLRAGCPPDGFNPLGQNWGFPIYDWDALKKDKFSWWKNRLKQASRYYQVFRIDHVLGFFRIWAIPSTDYTGYCGFTKPGASLTLSELSSRGYVGDRLRWLSLPHIPTSEIQAATDGDYEKAHKYLNKIATRLGEEELWLFKKSIKGEKDIYATDFPEPVKNAFADAWRNRMLLPMEDGSFRPLWSYKGTRAWESLSWNEKQELENLINQKGVESEKLWEAQARELLGALTECTKMIPCAEDLGANPDCVKPVLADLGIHSLKVLRWNRKWNEPGQPWYDLGEYPLLSVVTPAVHDTSTVRGWWNSENGREDVLNAWGNNELRENLAGDYKPESAQFILKTTSYANSRFYVVQIQDLLDLIPDFFNWTADEERVNLPGSVSTFNWTYRLPENLEDLQKRIQLLNEIQKVFDNRK